MAAGKSLTPAQNERVRELVRELVQRQGGNQTRVAPLLGVEQATLSRFLSGQQGTSVHVVFRVAELMDMDAADLLRGKPRRSKTDPKFPSRAGAEAAARVLGCTEEDIAEAIKSHDTTDDPGDVYWVNEFLRARDRRRRRQRHASEAPPASSQERPRRGRGT